MQRKKTRLWSTSTPRLRTPELCRPHSRKNIHSSIQYGVLSSGKDALLARYMLEARTGTYLADVYHSSVFPIMNLVEKGLLAKYYSPEREGYIEALRDKEGYWHATYLNAA